MINRKMDQLTSNFFLCEGLLNTYMLTLLYAIIIGFRFQTVCYYSKKCLKRIFFGQKYGKMFIKTKPNLKR